jgi:protein tyrosine/serine phosphatase
MHGSDRTGMMVASYRMVVEGWPREKALAELPAFGFHPMWRDIRKFLEGLDPKAVQASLQSASGPPVETVP